MKIQKFYARLLFSVLFLFASTSQAMELAAPEESGAQWTCVDDFFGVLWFVDKKQAELDNPPKDPGSPMFRAERTMCLEKWRPMDLGIATKEDVAQEAAEKWEITEKDQAAQRGESYNVAKNMHKKIQVYEDVLHYIGQIGLWVKPIPAGMELYKRIRSVVCATLLLSNISISCITGLKDPDYFSRVNETTSYQSPNIFADAHKTAQSGYPFCEGYSCYMGLDKPDVLCYKFFLTLNCPDIPQQKKDLCKKIQEDLLKARRSLFEQIEKHGNANAQEEQQTYDSLRALLEAQITEISEQYPALNDFITHTFFIDDSPRNLIGAAMAGIYPVSCQCHAVAYWTLVKKGIMPQDVTYEAFLKSNSKTAADVAHFAGWNLEELHDYKRIDAELHKLHPENYE